MITRTETNPLAAIHPAYLPLLLSEFNATLFNFDPPEQTIYVTWLLAEMAKFPAPGEPDQPATLPLLDPAAPGVTERVLLALMEFLQRVKEYRESQSWKVTAQELDDDDEEDEAEYAAARYARQRGQHRNPEPQGFPEFMTPPLDLTPVNALKNALDFLISDMSNARSFAAMGAKKARSGGATWKDKPGGPDWHGERHKHPTLDAAHRYGQALGVAVLHVAKRLKKTLADDPRKHLAHLAHGLAHALHPGGEE